MLKKDENSESFSLFVAPRIHQYAIEYSNFVKYKNNLEVRAISVKDLLDSIEIGPELSNIGIHSEKIVNSAN